MWQAYFCCWMRKRVDMTKTVISQLRPRGNQGLRGRSAVLKLLPSVEHIKSKDMKVHSHMMSHVRLWNMFSVINILEQLLWSCVQECLRRLLFFHVDKNNDDFILLRFYWIVLIFFFLVSWFGYLHVKNRISLSQMVKWSNRLIGEAQLNPSIPAHQTVAAVHWFDFFLHRVLVSSFWTKISGLKKALFMQPSRR